VLKKNPLAAALPSMYFFGGTKAINPIKRHPTNRTTRADIPLPPPSNAEFSRRRSPLAFMPHAAAGQHFSLASVPHPTAHNTTGREPPQPVHLALAG
jgi:hypothetical protein